MIIQIVTIEESGIDSMKDFEGKRIVVGAPENGAEANTHHIIQIHEFNL